MPPPTRRFRLLPNVLAWVLSAAALALGASRVAADDRVASLMAAPVSYTDVADAFEPGDPLDVNVRLSYEHNVASGTIQRELVDPNVHDGRRHSIDVADYSDVRKELGLRLEVGVYRDVMVYVRFPIVLSDDSELDAAHGACDASNASPECSVLRETVPGATQGQALFDLDPSAVSARRSGLPSVDFGAAWSITNQYRQPHFATWVVIAEASVATGPVMRPCLSGQKGCEPGISDGMNRFKLESRFSYRYRHVEPFFGLSHTFVWLGDADALYHPSGVLPNVPHDGPPAVTEVTLGSAFIPWEDRARYQRLELELHTSAALITAGRDFTPLFDALGTSQNPYLTRANSVGTRMIEFTGITQVEAYARLGLEGSATIQAARYVRFAIGAGFTHASAHLLTGAALCTASGGGVCPDERVNPVFRAAIDAPGNRFRLADALAFRFQIAAIAQF